MRLVIGLFLLLVSAARLGAEETQTASAKSDKANQKSGTPSLPLSHGSSADFSVAEVAGIDRPGWPVLFGMPFAPGQLKNADGVSICTASGKAVAQDHRVAAKWSDGSIKWLHLNCQLDLKKNANESFKVVYGQSTPASTPKPAAELKIKKDADSVSVDTGAISFTLSPTGGGVPENVKLAGGDVISKGGTHTLSFVESGPPTNTPERRGNWKRPLPDGAAPVELSATANKAEVSVEQQDNLSATVLVRGWYEGAGRKACRFDVRVTAFAGKPYLKIQHTLIYTEDPDKFFVSGLNYSFSFDGAQKAQFGGEGSASLDANPARGCYLLAPGPEINHNGILLADAPKQVNTFDVFEAGAKLDKFSGKEPAGWLAVQSAKSGIAVAVRDFRLLHPKELFADDHGITVGLWPAHAKLCIDCRNPRYGEKIRGETTLNGCACGWAKTHEIWVAYHAAATRAQAVDAVRAGQEPAYGIPDPKQFCDSGTMGQLAPVDRKAFPGMERQHDTYWAWLIRNAEVFHWDGFFNYGGILIEFSNHGERYSGGPPETWCWRDYAGWILNDGQEGHQAWRAYARSGDRRLLKFAEAIAHNIGDESTVHYFNPKVPHAHPVGGAHRHDMSPWGTIITTYSMDVLGNCDLWYCLGDLRARDVLRDYASDLAPGGTGLIERHAVGSLVTLIGEALNDPKLIEQAKPLYKLDTAECQSPNPEAFRRWTDCDMPAMLSLEVSPDDALRKGLFSASDAFVQRSHPANPGYCEHPGELLAWSYLQTKDKKYLDAMISHLHAWHVEGAAAHEGDPFSEDWPTLRKRMNEMPHGVVKTYINILRVGRYPAVIRALQAAGLTEKDALAIK